jgi:TetR/AcrR family transcriptional repressor of lmrAB and yxaGH operons
MTATTRPRPRGSSREAFLAGTAELLRRQGYAATGLSEIVAASGAPKGSLYFHFPGGKEQLAVEAMDRSAAQLTGAIGAILAAHERTGDALAALADALAEQLAGSGYASGCPIATVVLEQAVVSEPVREAGANAFAAWTDAIEQRLLSDGMAPAAASRRALLALCAIEGALIVSRAQRRPEPLREVAAELRALVA